MHGGGAVPVRARGVPLPRPGIVFDRHRIVGCGRVGCGAAASGFRRRLPTPASGTYGSCAAPPYAGSRASRLPGPLRPVLPHPLQACGRRGRKDRAGVGWTAGDPSASARRGRPRSASMPVRRANLVGSSSSGITCTAPRAPSSRRSEAGPRSRRKAAIGGRRGSDPTSCPSGRGCRPGSGGPGVCGGLGVEQGGRPGDPAPDGRGEGRRRDPPVRHRARNRLGSEEGRGDAADEKAESAPNRGCRPAERGERRLAVTVPNRQQARTATTEPAPQVTPESTPGWDVRPSARTPPGISLPAPPRRPAFTSTDRMARGGRNAVDPRWRDPHRYPTAAASPPRRTPRRCSGRPGTLRTRARRGPGRRCRIRR